jgi:hypothetical protein
VRAKPTVPTVPTKTYRKYVLRKDEVMKLITVLRTESQAAYIWFKKVGIVGTDR